MCIPDICSVKALKICIPFPKAAKAAWAQQQSRYALSVFLAIILEAARCSSKVFLKRHDSEKRRRGWKVRQFTKVLVQGLFQKRRNWPGFNNNLADATVRCLLSTSCSNEPNRHGSEKRQTIASSLLFVFFIIKGVKNPSIHKVLSFVMSCTPLLTRSGPIRFAFWIFFLRNTCCV